MGKLITGKGLVITRDLRQSPEVSKYQPVFEYFSHWHQRVIRKRIIEEIQALETDAHLNQYYKLETK